MKVEAILDLRAPGVVEGLVAEGREPIIAVGDLNGESYLVVVPQSPLRPGDQWWESMGQTFSVARRGEVGLEQAIHYEVTAEMVPDFARRIREARDLKSQKVQD